MKNGAAQGLQVLGLVELSIFLVFWSAITLWVDSMLARQAVCQTLAARYPTIRGTVIHSELKPQESPPLDLRYTYRVAGKPYVGTQFGCRYFRPSKNWSAKIVRSLPVGARVDVHYHPEDPARSQLHVGLDGAMLFTALFLTPFNTIMVGGWAVVIGEARRLTSSRSPTGVPVVRRGARALVRSNAWTPMLSACGSLIGLSMAGMFGVHFVFGDAVPLDLMLGVWAGLIGVVGIIYLVQRRRAVVLILEEDARRVRLPHGLHRERRVEIPFRAVLGVDVDETCYRDFHRELQDSFAPVLVFPGIDGAEQRERVVGRFSRAQAEQLACWLREMIGLQDSARRAPAATHGDSSPAVPQTSTASGESTPTAERPVFGAVDHRPWFGLQLVETPRTLEIVPGRIPRMAVALAMLLPAGAMAWAFLFGPARQVNAGWWAGALVTFLLVIPAFWGVVEWLNQQESGRGKFLVLDKLSGAVELPRLGVRLSRDQIAGLIDRRGRGDFSLADRPPESGRDIQAQRFAELNLLARRDDGELVRYPVVAEQANLRAVPRAAERLAAHLGVPFATANGPDALPRASLPNSESREAAADSVQPLQSRERAQLRLVTAGQIALTLADVGGIGLFVLGELPVWATVLLVLFGPLPLLGEWYKHRLRSRTSRSAGAPDS